MQIAKDTVVQFHYTLSDTTGEIESTKKGNPILYLHGYNQMIPALELELEGKAAGDTLEVTLPPEKTYGLRDENAIQTVQVKHLLGASKWKPGMVAVIQTPQGQRQVTIVKVGMFKAEVDSNHPLAGKTLTFNVDILAVRPATEEELSHGHAHGEGGHHH